MSSFSLRLLALALMAADHLGLAVFPAAPAFRWVGRMAFPIYCFLLCEGYVHTRDLRAYARRLALFAILSEIPFDLLIFARVACAAEQNALFALLLSLFSLWTADALRGRTALLAAAEAALMAAAMLARVSYGWLGPALCLCFYLSRGRRARMLACAGALLALYALSLLLSGVEPAWALAALFALPALAPLALYNGRRGPRAPALTFLFYAAYPAHLLLLVWLRAARLVPPYLFL